jgi:hypothetical protein
VWPLEIFCLLFSKWNNKHRAVWPLYLVLRATKRQHSGVTA